MKKIFASFGWLLLLLPFISVAGTKTLLNTIKHEVSIEDRQVSDFTGISSGGSYNVYVKFGQTESLRIEGDEDEIKSIETKVEQGILKIRNFKNSTWSWGSREKVKIYITAKSLNSLSLSGSGSMEISGITQANVINTQVSGSGSMRLNIQASTLNASVSGSGNLRVAGSTKAAHISVSGSGRFDGKSLKTYNTDAKVSGSGGLSIHADQHLNAALSGSGNIVYSGNAQVNSKKSGSGRISKD